MNPDYPKVARREEWLAARLQLLAQEKALTRLHDRYQPASASAAAHDCCH
ncbi:MAG: hypothetical protein ACRCTL_11850 [Pseudomonas sp.]